MKSFENVNVLIKVKLFWLKKVFFWKKAFIWKKKIKKKINKIVFFEKNCYLKQKKVFLPPAHNSLGA